MKKSKLSYWLFIDKRTKLKKLDKPLITIPSFFKDKKNKKEVNNMSETKTEVLTADVIELRANVKKKLKLNEKKMVALIEAKKEEFNGLINDSAVIKILGKEVGLIKELKNEDLNEAPEWLNVGKLLVPEGKIVPEKGYEYLANLELRISALSGVMREDYSWSIIGSNEANRTSKGDGVFLRLSKSKKAFTFWIGDKIFSISVQLFQENQAGEIPVSTPNKNKNKNK